MRKILFKARRNVGGEWVTGHYGLTFMGSHTISCKVNGVFVTDTIDPETLCEYTGRDTDDGKPFFEGDIIVAVVHNERREVVIFFDAAYAAFRIKNHGNGVSHMSDTFYTMPWKKKGVIKGNIHDD